MTAPRHLWSGDWRRESAASERELAERRAQDEQPTAAHAATPAKAPAPPRPEPAAPAPAPRARVEKPAVRTQPAARLVPDRRAESAEHPRTTERTRTTERARTAERAQPARRERPAPRPTQRERRRMSGPRIVVVVLAALVSAGIAYAVVSTVVGTGTDNSTPPISQGNPPSQTASASNGPAWLGVQTQSLASAGGGFSSGSGNTGGFPSGSGAVVTNVAPGSPADAAGLEPGDVITQIDNQSVNSPDDINSALAGMRVGQSVEIQYQRGPFADAAQVTLAARPAGSP